MKNFEVCFGFSIIAVGKNKTEAKENAEKEIRAIIEELNSKGYNLDTDAIIELDKRFNPIEKEY